MERFDCAIFGGLVKKCDLKDSIEKKDEEDISKRINNPRCKECPTYKKLILSFLIKQPDQIQKPPEVKMKEYKIPKYRKTFPEKINKWSPPKSVKKDVIPDESYQKNPDLEHIVNQ